jgi:hypothetical protein
MSVFQALSKLPNLATPLGAEEYSILSAEWACYGLRAVNMHVARVISESPHDLSSHHLKCIAVSQYTVLSLRLGV